MQAPSPSNFRELGCFQRRFLVRLKPARGPLDVVPLISVTLLVFLFLLIHSSFVLRPGIAVNLPSAAFLEGAPYGSAVVTVTQQGMIFFNDERTHLEKLGPALTQAVFERPDMTLVIEADEMIRNNTLVQIYNIASIAGVKKIVLATRPPTVSETAP